MLNDKVRFWLVESVDTIHELYHLDVKMLNDKC